MLEWWSKNLWFNYISVSAFIVQEAMPHEKPNELPNQIKLLRQYPNVQGGIYFENFNNNPNGWSDSLRNNYYRIRWILQYWLLKIKNSISSFQSIYIIKLRGWKRKGTEVIFN
jgi:hypothetical protein